MERIYRCDIAVVGGGTAGVAAVVGAKRAGADVILIERNPYLGGEATHSGVSAFCGFYSCGGDPVKVVAGVGDNVLEEMEKLGPTIEYIISAAGNKNINFQPEYLKCAMDNLLEQEEITVLLHARVIGAESRQQKITSLLCVDDEGTFVVEAASYVDASGDANLVHLAGGRTLWGDEEGAVQAVTLPFRLSGVDTSQDMSPAAVEKAVIQAKAEGIPNLTREKGFILKKEGSGVVSVLLPSAMLTNMTAQELSNLEKQTRKQVLSYVEALKHYMPGMENAELVVIGPSIGFRETRRMLGREMIQTEDVLNRKKRSDGVARGGWKPEIHKSLNKMATYLEVSGGSYFDIPLGALWSADIENLFGAGRMVCADEAAFAAVRVMGTCFATGHSAGVAAACQALHHKTDVEEIRAELQRQGALV